MGRTGARGAARRRKGRSGEPAWADAPDQELLRLRLKDLGVQIDNAWLPECIGALNDELAARDIRAQAHCWLSDEWFSPSNTPGIAIPFYLAHPRLMRLERKMMREVEGGTRRDCMRLLRHEAGHVVQHAYGLHRRRRWQNLFGRSSRPYPDQYRPNPTSRNYVQHLRRWYAQAHPDEDFAETFAVWLTPRSNWRRRYADWPVALEKLLYVDELMGEIAGQKPTLTKRVEVDPVHTLRKTLGEHYRQRLEHYAIDAPSAFDRDLLRIFPLDSRAGAPPAAAFVRRHRAELAELAAERKGDEIPLAAVLDDIVDRCRALNLRAGASSVQTKRALVRLLTNKTVHALYSSRRRQSFAV